MPKKLSNEGVEFRSLDGDLVIPAFCDLLDDSELQKQHAALVKQAGEFRDALGEFRDRLANFPREPKAAIAFGIETKIQEIDLLDAEANLRAEAADLCNELSESARGRMSFFHSEKMRLKDEVANRMLELGVESKPAIADAQRNNSQIRQALSRYDDCRQYGLKCSSLGQFHERSASHLRGRHESACREIAGGTLAAGVISFMQAKERSREG